MGGEHAGPLRSWCAGRWRGALVCLSACLTRPPPFPDALPSRTGQRSPLWVTPGQQRCSAHAVCSRTSILVPRRAASAACHRWSRRPSYESNAARRCRGTRGVHHMRKHHLRGRCTARARAERRSIRCSDGERGELQGHALLSSIASEAAALLQWRHLAGPAGGVLQRRTTPVGSDIEITGDAIAAQMGVKASFQNTGFDGIIPAVLLGEARTRSSRA